MPAIAAPKEISVPFSLGWDGIPFHGTHEHPVAFDTETSIDNDLDPGAVNRLALVQVSDGVRTALLHPDQLPDFLKAHQNIPFVGHNFPYDFWVVLEHLKKQRLDDLASAWWEKIDRGLTHDTMFLDALLRLAEGKGETGEDGDKLYLRGLGDIAWEYAGIRLNKEDPYRRRYGEIIGKKFSEVKEPGFWTYAAKDAYATAHTWIPMYRRAMEIIHRFAMGLGEHPKKRLERWSKYGLLTEQVQIKGAIALQSIERNGMPYDPEEAALDEARWRPKVEASVEKINKIRPFFFKKKNGRFEYSAKSKVPKINQFDLEQALAEAGLKIKEAVPGFEPPQSDGKTKELKGFAISRSAQDWEPYARYDPFLEAWVQLSECTKRLGFYSMFSMPEKTLFTEIEPAHDWRVRSRINPLMRTGRTSYQKPNLQQAPRDGEFRSIFHAPRGKKILTIDFSAIELRTLAATCYERYGYSKLGDVIRSGVDPHAYTAAMINDMSLKEFMALKKEDPDKYKAYRQSAKALNFGIPGGLGSTKLVAYAAANYGVILTPNEAETFRRRIITEVYPELNDKDGYLADDTVGAMALNTGLSKGEIKVALPANGHDWVPRVVSRIAAGYTNKASGDPYDSNFLSDCWDFLEGIGRRAPRSGPLSDSSRKKLLARIGDSILARDLTMSHAVTLTGRIRSRVRYTVARNTPFQGLAADGAKLALFELCRQHYMEVAFIHDEIVFELDEEGSEAAAEEIKKVMCREMEKVLDNVLPVEAEYHLGNYWAK